MGIDGPILLYPSETVKWVPVLIPPVFKPPHSVGQNAPTNPAPSVCWAVLSCSRCLPNRAAAQPLAAGRLLAAMPLRDSWCPAGASPPYGWGVPPAGKTAFSFVGERGVFYLTVGFLPTRLGAKTTFSFACKRKSGSGLLKRKGRPVEMITDYGTTVQSPNPA